LRFGIISFLHNPTFLLQKRLELIYNFSYNEYHETGETMDTTMIVAKCLEHANVIMQFIEGKENFLALAKVFLFCLILGNP